MLHEFRRSGRKQSSDFQPLLNLLTKPKQTKGLIKLVWSLSWIASVQIGSLLQTDRQ